MRLTPKIVLSFVAFIAFFGAVSAVSTSVILNHRMRREVETAEVAFTRSLSTRLFKSIREKDSAVVTDTLLEELQLRPEKLAYLLVLDEHGQRFAHTFLGPVPAELSRLGSPPRAGETTATGAATAGGGPAAYAVQRIEDGALDVYDVSVPVLEGIAAIGSVHLGLRGEYLEGIKRDLIRMTTIATSAIGLFALFVAFWLTRRIVQPVRQLTEVANQLSAGNLNVKLPGLKSKDEIQELETSLGAVLAAVETLMADVPTMDPATPTDRAS